MRVIGGTARGRTLRAPLTESVRPTSDRAREAIFDVLAHLDAIDGADVLDLFAGSGALGIEAVSRGARSATFVERDRVAAATITANLAVLGEDASRARLVRADALGYLRGPHRVDVAFVDPPYAFDGWSEILARLDADLVVAESDRELTTSPRYEPYRSYRYGSTLVHIVRRVPDTDGTDAL